MIDDDRPVAKDARAHVGKAGYRSPGMGTRRLSLVASPVGVPMGYRDLVARIDATPSEPRDDSTLRESAGASDGR